jgi:hypothetical protein
MEEIIKTVKNYLLECGAIQINQESTQEKQIELNNITIIQPKVIRLSYPNIVKELEKNEK